MMAWAMLSYIKAGGVMTKLEYTPLVFGGHKKVVPGYQMS